MYSILASPFICLHKFLVQINCSTPLWLAEVFPSRPCPPRPRIFRNMRCSLVLITRLLLSKPEVAKQKTGTESPLTIPRACFYHTKIHIYILLILLLRKHRTLSVSPPFFSFSTSPSGPWTVNACLLWWLVLIVRTVNKRKMCLQ